MTRQNVYALYFSSLSSKFLLFFFIGVNKSFSVIKHAIYVNIRRIVDLKFTCELKYTHSLTQSIKNGNFDDETAQESQMQQKKRKNLILFLSCVALWQFEWQLILSHLNSLALLLSSETGGIMFILLYGNACGTCFLVTIRSVFFFLLFFFRLLFWGGFFHYENAIFPQIVRLRVPPRTRYVYLFRVALVMNAMLHTIHRASSMV